MGDGRCERFNIRINASAVTRKRNFFRVGKDGDWGFVRNWLIAPVNTLDNGRKTEPISCWTGQLRKWLRFTEERAYHLAREVLFSAAGT